MQSSGKEYSFLRLACFNTELLLLAPNPDSKDMYKESTLETSGDTTISIVNIS